MAKFKLGVNDLEKEFDLDKNYDGYFSVEKYGIAFFKKNCEVTVE